MAARWRFDGEIAAFGTTSGHRVVIGRWPVSPFGPFSDVMLETPEGTRVLLAPSAQVAHFIASTYCFDAVHVEPVTAVRHPATLTVVTRQLRARLSIGRRGWPGLLLRALPRAVATAPLWATLVDPLVRVLLPGVRTRGSARSGHREWYGARDLRRLVSVTAQWQGNDLGTLADVVPPVRFGFGSAPRHPSIVRLTTTVRDAGGLPVRRRADPAWWSLSYHW